MFLSDLRGALLRFWYVALVGVLVAVGCGYATAQAVPLKYEARALVLLLPPKSLLNIGGNPYLALGGLDSAAAVLGRAMMDSETALNLDEVAPGMEYAVEPDASTSGPVLMAVVESDTSAGTLRALDRLIDGFAPRFEQMQRETGAPTDSLISVTLVTKDVEATTIRKDQLRAVLAVVALALMAALGATALAGRLFAPTGGSRERRRRSPKASQQAEDSPTTTPPVPDGPLEASESAPAPTEVEEQRELQEVHRAGTRPDAIDA